MANHQAADRHASGQALQDHRRNRGVIRTAS
jgi:hypothetical protein